MKTLAATTLLAALLSAPAMAQKLDLNLDSVAMKAAQKTELTLEGPALEIFKLAMSKPEPGLYSGVNGVSLRNYEFAKSGDYSDRDLETLRKQVSHAAGWSRMLSAKDKDSDTEIYILTQGDKPSGFLLISAEPKELTVIQVSGFVPLAQVQELIKSTIQYKDTAQP